jgi:hypothetical protein
MATPSLINTFEDLYLDVAEYEGLGRSVASDNLAKVKRRVNSGYKRALSLHKWQFMFKDAVLITEANKWQYELPDDFGSVSIGFKYPPDDIYTDIADTDYDNIISLRTATGNSTGRPYVYAISDIAYAEILGSRKQVSFHYTPSGRFVLSYQYKVIFNELSTSTDVPVGGSACKSLFFCRK